MQPFNSERLYYRPFRRSDVEAAFVVFGDPEVMRYSTFGPHPDTARTADILGYLIAHNQRRGFGFWAVILPDTQDLIGFAGLAELDDTGEIELGYRLRRDCWGQGYGSEAAAAWVAKAFDRLRLPRIVAIVEPDNLVSKRILEKVGLRPIDRRIYHGKPVDYMVLDRPADA